MGADIAFYRGRQRGPYYRGVSDTPKRSYFIMFFPVRAMVRCEFVEQLLAFVLRVWDLLSLRAGSY